MAEKYTEEELKAMTRVELRRAAMEVLGVDNKEVSNAKSDDLRDRILAAQEGGGKKTGKAAPPAGKGKGLPSTSKGKPAPEPEPEEPADEEPPEEAPPKGKAAGRPAAAPSGSVDTKKHFDALGKAVDEMANGQQENHATVIEQLNEIERKQFIMLGLLTDIFKAVNEPDALEERLNELQGEWEAQNSEGNE